MIFIFFFFSFFHELSNFFFHSFSIQFFCRFLVGWVDCTSFFFFFFCLKGKVLAFFKISFSVLFLEDERQFFCWINNFLFFFLHKFFLKFFFSFFKFYSCFPTLHISIFLVSWQLVIGHYSPSHNYACTIVVLFYTRQRR